MAGKVRTPRSSISTPSVHAASLAAAAELAASFVDWLAANDPALGVTAPQDLAVAAEAFRTAATAAKALQFALARASRGRKVDLKPSFDELSQASRSTMDGLEGRYGN